MGHSPRYRVEQLAWRDIVVAEVALPKRTLVVTLGLGSGLSRRPGDAPGRIWAIGDRGANLKIPDAVERYGLEHLEPLRGIDGAKVLPLPGCGPTLCELQITGEAVELVRTLPLLAAGQPISGRPPVGGTDAAMEPTYGIEGERLAGDPDGADTEGLAALADGTFRVADEYGPSILSVGLDGEVLERWTPKGQRLPGAAAPVRDVLPASAARRRLNRGFEGIAATPDGETLFVAFQSALEGDDPDAALIWALDARTGQRKAEFLYPFDRPKRFRRDAAAGKVSKRDLKICDLAWAGPERLLVLERISRSAKIYSVALRGEILEKELVFDIDDAPEIAADLEGMTLTSDRELILVNDNDFGTEGVETAFFRVTFEQPI
ncbi:MAG: esterase-like of phytase family protein [Caulobacteraceae bacterium]|nr:esterase-like of phytase family protein [Caulobacteraceae bacterium]